MKKIGKILIMCIVIALVIYFSMIHVFNDHKNPVASTGPSGHSKTSISLSHTKQIAGIVYLTSSGLPSGTIQSLKDMHATEVYLYVAYHSDAYFNIPANNDGLAEPANSLSSALSTLHQDGYKVIAVISSALIDRQNITPEGEQLLQPREDIINPQKASSLVLGLVQNLSQYPVDGIYVGEPYWVNTEGLSSAQKLQWNTLYQKIISITHNHHISSYMLLPHLYSEGVSSRNISGLNSSFIQLPFDNIGIDLENAYTGSPSTNLLRFRHSVAQAVSMSNRSSIEISLRQLNLSSPIPVNFFSDEVQICIQDHVGTIVVFANEWMSSSPYEKQYSQALATFLHS